MGKISCFFGDHDWVWTPQPLVMWDDGTPANSGNFKAICSSCLKRRELSVSYGKPLSYEYLDKLAPKPLEEELER